MSAFIVLEMYNNPSEYSSANERIPFFRASCDDLNSAAELVAADKIRHITAVTENNGHESSSGLYVVQAPKNVLVDPLRLPRLLISSDLLTEETWSTLQKKLKELADFNEKKGVLKGTSAGSNIAVKKDPLHVNVNTYERDRRAREWELMRRMNIQPMSAGRIPPPIAPPPQPAQPVVVTKETPSSTVTMATTEPLSTLKMATKVLSPQEQIPVLTPTSVGTAANPVSVIPSTTTTAARTTVSTVPVIQTNTATLTTEPIVNRTGTGNSPNSQITT